MEKHNVVLFDLYGTLLHFNHAPLIKEIAKHLAIPTKRVAQRLLDRELYIVTSTTESIIKELLASLDLSVASKEKLYDECLNIFERHLSSISLMDGAIGVLSFLKARGYHLGLISNLSSAFKKPVYSFALDKYFDVMVFSCDCGVAKPGRAIYQSALTLFNTTPEHCFFIGDSPQNDFHTPIAMGMRALLITPHEKSTHQTALQLAELAWFDIDENNMLLCQGGQLTLNQVNYSIQALSMLPDAHLGQYNIVGRVVLHKTDHPGVFVSHYIKRFSHEGSAVIEKLAYDIQAMVGLPGCEAHIINGREDFLITSEVKGEKWQDSDSKKCLYALGQHFAMAYIFSNADFRPRNIIVEQTAEGEVLKIIDFEHCFFSVALDLHGIERPDIPSTFDNMPAEEISRRTKHQVLSPKHCRRVLKGFLAQVDEDEFSVFSQGWLAMYNKVNSELEVIEKAMRMSIATQPYPIVGTSSYRRAMASFDIDAVLRRANENANAVCQGLR